MFVPFKSSAHNYNLESRIESTSYLPGDEIKIEIILHDASPGMLLEGFECHLSYTDSELRLKKILSHEPISRNQLKTETKENLINIKYNPKKLKEILSENSEITLYEIYLKTYKKTTPKNIVLHTEFFNCDSKEKLASNDLRVNIIENPEIQNCRLKYLLPDTGSLSPEFSSNQFNYSMSVPSDTKYLDFEFAPLNENFDVKINRRKLNAAGKTTHFKITVSNKQLKVKQIYEIEVFRKSANKKSSKKSKQSSPKNKKKQELFSPEDLDKNECSESVTENLIADNNSNNNNSNIYLIASISVISLGLISYILYEFIKYRKKISKNTSKPINKS